MVLLAGEFLRECKPYIEEGVHPQIIIRSFRLAASLAIQELKRIAVTLDKNDPEKLRELLQKCASTTLNSKVCMVGVCSRWAGGVGWHVGVVQNGVFVRVVR